MVVGNRDQQQKTIRNVDGSRESWVNIRHDPNLRGIWIFCRNPFHRNSFRRSNLAEGNQGMFHRSTIFAEMSFFRMSISLNDHFTEGHFSEAISTKGYLIPFSCFIRKRIIYTLQVTFVYFYLIKGNYFY